MAKRNLLHLEIKGLKELTKAFAQHEKIIKKHASKAMNENALIVQGALRDVIRKGKFKRNAELTAAIKGRNSPLIDKNKLASAIRTQKIKWNETYVGIKESHPFFRIARFLHEGGYVKVTPEMRTMFFMLWLASKHARGERMGEPPKLTGQAAALFARYKNWYPLSLNTKRIYVPARPFIQDVTRDLSVRVKLRSNWERAVSNALAEIAASTSKVKGGRKRG